MTWACIGRLNNVFHVFLTRLNVKFAMLVRMHEISGERSRDGWICGAANRSRGPGTPQNSPEKNSPQTSPEKKTSLKTCQKCDGKNVEKSCLSSSCRGLHLDIKRIMYAPEHCSASPLKEILLEFTLLIIWELWVSCIYASKWCQLQCNKVP